MMMYWCIMRKIGLNRLSAVIILTVLSVLTLAGCGKKDVAPEDEVEVLMITDIGTVDDGSYNQGTWEGILRYTSENNITAKYYVPSGIGTEAYLEEIQKGVDNGAKVIVCSGYLMEETIYEAQKKYPKVNFILVDGIPHNEDFSDIAIAENTMSISFEEEESGFLAGYAAVRDGYTNLAFMGGVPEDPVIRYGYGFVQGADYASIQIGLPVSIRYTYTNTYLEDESVEATAASWYENGTEVIFACGGDMGRSVMRAAENHGGKVIGVDIDQSKESDTVITCAMKSLDKAVYKGLSDYYSGTFKGGENTLLSAADSCVCLSIQTSKFNRFDWAEYQSIYQQLVDGIIDPYGETNIGTCEELTLINTEVSYIVP